MVQYREGLYVGYRYYQTAGVPVAFPFGYGLSYTSFAYSNLQAASNSVTLTVTNTGKRAGAEIVQLYVAKPGAEVFRPAQELKGFAKVQLQPGESKTVTIPLDDKAFRYWNTKTDSWEVEGGSYELRVGASSADHPPDRRGGSGRYRRTQPLCGQASAALYQRQGAERAG